MKRYRRGVFGILLTLSLLFSPHIKAADMNQKLAVELMAALDDFAQKHALSGPQMEKLLGDIVLDGQQFRKGGVGTIDKEVYVVLNEPRNTIIVAGKKWEGKKSSEPELVLTNGQDVLNSQAGLDVSKLIIILFSPKEVRFINLSNNSGGKYLR